MRQKHLKYVRIAAAAVMFVLFVAVGIGVRQVDALLVTQFGPGLIRLTSGLFLGTLAALVVIAAVTLLFGRIYCSVLCPLGILQDGIAFLTHWNWKKWKRSRYRFLDTRPVKYGVFLFVLVLAAAGVALPLAALLPSSNFFTAVSNVFLRLFGTTGATDGRFSVNPPAAAFFFSLAVFLVVAVMAAWRGRLYCNTLCPVGAVLSLLGRSPLYRITLSQSMCVSCGMCEAVCKGGAINAKMKSVLAENCVMCFNCIGACKRGGVTIEKRPKMAAFSVSRRHFLGAAGGVVAGAGAYLLVRRVEKAMPHPSSEPAMPPGAGNAGRFHAKCVGCGVCIRECEGKVLVPSITQYGLAGFMQPVVDYSRGSCVYTCDRCSNVCPAGALLPLALATKQTTRIGMASVDSDSCIGCGKCAAQCPAKAIEMVLPEGRKNRLAVVSHEFCIGCGACQHVCPVKSGPAITVAGVSEQILVAKAPEVVETEAEKARRASAEEQETKPEETADPAQDRTKPEETSEAVQDQPPVPAKRIAVPDLGACFGCGLCAEDCPVSAITMVDGLPKVDADVCVGCGLCAEGCPAGAIAMQGGE